MMKLGILTSSRADFGIYLPLLKALRNDSFFDFKLIVFGTHLSKYHGYTIDEILNNGFTADYQIESILINDDATSVATSYALTALKFADFWGEHKCDFNLVFCLGDRYEMAAAVMAGVPHNIRFAHIHAGETTLGAIDNVYRHSISLASDIFFISTEIYADRIEAMVGNSAKCYVTGSLSLENLKSIKFLKKSEFYKKWEINPDLPFILITVHPETIDYQANKNHAIELGKALEDLAKDYQLVITMPNADTNGSIFRDTFYTLKSLYSDKIILVDNFGTTAYFSCMKYADFLLGNTSSGIIEAASFGKFVINLGDRQKGRLASTNIISTPFNHTAILESSEKIRGKKYEGENIYYKPNPSQLIISALK